MSNRRKIYGAINRAYLLVEHSKYEDIDLRYEFKKQLINRDNSLTENEKSEAIKILTKSYDEDKILINEGIKRICENCNQECLATLFCEHCVQNYLKAKFSNWTSGNKNIDDLIKECQMKSKIPSKIAEWIPYNNFKNIKYLTKGGFSEIYTAIWVGGRFFEWDSENQQLKRFGNQKVILKELGNFENASQNWFEEVKSHLTVCNKWNAFVQCFGLTQDPSNKNFMLVINKMDMDLRKYLQQHHKELTWKERIQIVFYIVSALKKIHNENIIHRDLHSGNILFTTRFSISDLGCCGPADKPSKSVYGNLPYIAPEVIQGKQTTKASDIYSVAILMWEISSGLPPFFNFQHDYDLAMNIVNGIRPKIVPGTPLEYENLMKQCWNADLSKRPDTYTLWKKVDEIKNKQNESLELLIGQDINNYIDFDNANSLKYYSVSTSKVHQFENLPEPRNATEEELEAFHSKPHDFHIPHNINDFGESVSQKDSNDILVDKGNSGDLSKVFNELQISSKTADNQYSCNNEVTVPKQRNDLYINDDEGHEAHNNSNLHSEEQNELELPDNI